MEKAIYKHLFLKINKKNPIVISHMFIRLNDFIQDIQYNE